MPLYIVSPPPLEYGNTIWAPQTKKYKMLVEAIQRCATNTIPELKDIPYEDRLRRLKLPSLMYRRRRRDMTQTYKILKGIDRINPDILFSRAESTITRGHSEKLLKPRSRLQTRAHSFCRCVIEDWNSLPESLISTKTINSFKSGIDRDGCNEQYKLP